LYIDDLSDACLLLLLHYYKACVVNIGTREDVATSELAEIIKNIVGYERELELDHLKSDSTPRKLLDIQKLKSLGWQYKILLKSGLHSIYNELVKF
jgi:GDP-L-fucose synthase